MVPVKKTAKPKPRGHAALKALIKSAGGPTAFVKKVWSEADDPRSLTGKVHKWSEGDNGPSLESAAEIAEAFGISLDEIWGSGRPGQYPTAKKIALQKRIEDVLQTEQTRRVETVIAASESRIADLVSTELNRLRKDLELIYGLRSKPSKTPRSRRQP